MTAPMLDIGQLQERLDASPFSRWLDLRVESVDAAGLHLSMGRRAEMVGSPHTGALHGGLLGCLVDTTGAFALIAITGQTVATIDYRINFHRPALEGRVHAKAQVVHAGRRIGTVEIRVHDDAGRLLASGQGVYLDVALTPGNP